MRLTREGYGLVRFRSRPDGTKYPIDDSKGKGGGAAVATVVALAMAASGGGMTAGSIGGAGESAIGRSVQVQANKAKQSAKRGDTKRAWRQLRLKEIKQTAKRDLNCALNSFGQVRQFLIDHPCRSLKRAVLIIADEHGNTGLVSVAWVQMRSYKNARRLKALDDKNGTGDITTVGSTALRSRGVEFTGKYYAGLPSRSLFVRAEAVPVTGSMNPQVLDGAAHMSVYLPPP